MGQDKENSCCTGSKLHLLAVIPVILVIYLRSPISASLWLDETITFWIGQGSLQELFKRCSEYQAQSSLFFFIEWLTLRILAAPETVLRYPSLLAALLSCFLIYKIAVRLFDGQAAAFALLLFIGLDEFLKSAFSARPYALALFSSLASVFWLFSWLETGRLRHLILYMIFTLLMLYLHFLFVAFIAIQLLMVYCQPKKSASASVKTFLLSQLGIALLFLPALSKILDFSSRHQIFYFAKNPDLAQLLKTVFPFYLLIYLGTALAFSAAVCKGFSLTKPAKTGNAVIGFLIIWAAAPPLAFFLHALLSGNSLFLQRHFLWQAPALALLSALIFSCIKSPKARLIVTATACLLLLVRESARKWNIEDWRTAAAIINQNNQAGRIPVLAYSGLIELEQVAWLNDPEKKAYLLAPFSPYPITSQAAALPSEFSSRARIDYFNQTIKPLLEKNREALLVALQLRPPLDKTKKGDFVHENLIGFFTEQGYSAVEIPGAGLVKIYRLLQTKNKARQQ